MAVRTHTLEARGDLVFDVSRPRRRTLRESNNETEQSQPVLRITNGQFEALNPVVLPRDIEGPLAWQALSLCAQTDPEIFFPDTGLPAIEVRSICYECEVSQECLAHKLNSREWFGFAGGFSGQTRINFLKGLGIEVDHRYSPEEE